MNTHACCRAQVDKISRLPYLAKPTTPKWQVVLAQTAFDQTVGSTLVISGFFVFFGYINAAADGVLLSTGVPALFAKGVAKVRQKRTLPPTLHSA